MDTHVLTDVRGTDLDFGLSYVGYPHICVVVQSIQPQVVGNVKRPQESPARGAEIKRDDA
jgi:hypothetical protein